MFVGDSYENADVLKNSSRQNNPLEVKKPELLMGVQVRIELSVLVSTLFYIFFVKKLKRLSKKTPKGKQKGGKRNDSLTLRRKEETVDDLHKNTCLSNEKLSFF